MADKYPIRAYRKTMMDTERILHLADVIEAVPHKRIPIFFWNPRKLTGFKMRGAHCGRVGSIWGWAGQVFNCRYHEAQEALGLGDREADHLFLAPEVKFTNSVTPADAAAVLRNLAATGKVDWSIVCEVQEPQGL